MKVLIFIALLIASVYSAEVVAVGDKFKDSSKCQACHNHLVEDWQHSWHARSYEKNDEYFRASVEYVSKKSHKSLNAVKVECATCHNPRSAITKPSEVSRSVCKRSLAAIESGSAYIKIQTESADPLPTRPRN